MNEESPNDAQRDWDPTFLQARREAVLVLLAFLFWLCWTVGACWRLGYRSPQEQIELILGFPSWVFWGVLVPWIAATVFSVAFALRHIADDALGDSADIGEPPEEPGNE